MTSKTAPECGARAQWEVDLENRNDIQSRSLNGGTGAEPPSPIYYSKHNCNTESPTITEDVKQAGDLDRPPVEASSPKARTKNHRCGRMTLFGSHPGGKYSYRRQRCKAYNCGHCRKLKFRRVQHRISGLA